VDEELTLTDLRVTGSLPEHLDGRYLRIGPNPVTAPDPAKHKWFFGDGMVHGVQPGAHPARVPAGLHGNWVTSAGSPA
jgi:carotenoid cleavage dioxygenase-like enzyme